jgi:heme/copper-type cytochrome/quinol oxidase subunit 4
MPLSFLRFACVAEQICSGCGETEELQELHRDERRWMFKSELLPVLSGVVFTFASFVLTVRHYFQWTCMNRILFLFFAGISVLLQFIYLFAYFIECSLYI